MKYKKDAAAKDNSVIHLRSLTPQDAQSVIELFKKTAGETEFMMRYPNEWTITQEKECEALARAENAPKELMLGAFINGNLAGIANFRPAHPADRARHRAQLGVSVLRAYWDRGVGTAMMHALIEAAKTTALEYLELSVIAGNTRAKALYDRLGFIEYGRQPRAIKYRDGRYDDLILMQLDLRHDA